jgi:hypothetical protein
MTDQGGPEEQPPPFWEERAGRLVGKHLLVGITDPEVLATWTVYAREP